MMGGGNSTCADAMEAGPEGENDPMEVQQKAGGSARAHAAGGASALAGGEREEGQGRHLPPFATVTASPCRAIGGNSQHGFRASR